MPTCRPTGRWNSRTFCARPSAGEPRAREIIAQNDRWKILVDTTVPKPGDILSLSLAYGLSSYDAAYLDLAIRLHLPIAAKDGALRAAAVAAGVGVFAP